MDYCNRTENSNQNNNIMIKDNNVNKVESSSKDDITSDTFKETADNYKKPKISLTHINKDDKLENTNIKDNEKNDDNLKVSNQSVSKSSPRNNVLNDTVNKMLNCDYSLQVTKRESKELGESRSEINFNNINQTINTNNCETENYSENNRSQVDQINNNKVVEEATSSFNPNWKKNLNFNYKSSNKVSTNNANLLKDLRISKQNDKPITVLNTMYRINNDKDIEKEKTKECNKTIGVINDLESNWDRLDLKVKEEISRKNSDVNLVYDNNYPKNSNKLYNKNFGYEEYLKDSNYFNLTGRLNI